MNNELNERMASYGPAALNNRELFTLVTGDEKLAAAIMGNTKGKLKPLFSMPVSQLKEMGKATEKKIGKILATIELGKRKVIEEVNELPIVRSSEDIARRLQAEIGDSDVEKFVVLFLNRVNRIKKTMVLSQGGITGTVADPRVILRHALLEQATSIVLGHNHPSGSTRPSRADEDITKKIKEAGKYCDITVLDHIIVTQDSYFSFADEGLI